MTDCNSFLSLQHHFFTCGEQIYNNVRANGIITKKKTESSNKYFDITIL